ncbi:MAG: pyrroloquinoline-quinone synthase PqqC [Alphaproteobacteria bacterium]|nr:pyrroloquinoline-quinone synthase PqqC [Alphaproteobacteria bacterium]
MTLLSPAEFEARFKAVGAERYHNHHPFHRMLHDGKLNKGQVQAWALNRYIYQSRIPIKDAIIVSRLPTPELRALWRVRIEDHDGTDGTDGGIARWLKLTDGLGLDRKMVIAETAVLPATVFAADAYVHFVRDRTLLEAVASSLTELFAPKIIAERVEGMLAGYNFVSRETLAYFGARMTQAPRDADFALRYCIETAKTRDQQDACIAALTFKCNVLWAMLDALYHAYVAPGHIPPGAFRS